MAKPQRLYSATISYRTPARRRVLYGTVVAARNQSECERRLRERLVLESQHGRRRIAMILDDFHGIFFATQGASRKTA